MAATVIGLEITEESVRAVELTGGKAPTLVASGEVLLPPGAAKDSEIVDSDAVALALRQLWTQAGFKGRKVVLGVGSRRILVREFSTPSMSIDLIKSSLPYQVQDLLPVPVHQAVLDFYPVSEDGGQVHGLLVAAVSETIEDLVATLTKAKLQATAVDLVPFGLARVARVVGPVGATVAIVYVGDHTTYVVVTTDGVPQFVRVIPIDLPTEGVRRRDVAEEILEEALSLVPAGATRSRGASRFGESTVDPAVTDLVSRLRSTLAFHTSRPGAEPVSTVFVTGPGSSIPGVVPALVSALESRVERFSVTNVVTVRGNAEPSPNLISTLGVVLGEEK